MKRIVLTLCIFGLAIVLSACGGGGGGGGGGVAPIAQVPSVVATSPLPGATGVATNASIQVIFSEAMEAAPTAAAFGIAPAVQGSATVAGTVLTFLPAAALPVATNYTVTVAASARAVSGVTMSAPHVFTFRTDGASSNGPARVTDLALLQGTGAGGGEFGMLRLAFTAPAAGTGGAVASYQVRYSGLQIADANFAQATPLPAGIAIPAPASAGTQRVVTVDSSLLPAVEPGEALHFAMRAVDASGGAAAVSNGVSTPRPWKMTLRFTPDGGQPFPVEVGQQATAADATDAFDQVAPPALLSFAANLALAGRPEALLRDIRDFFPSAGQQTLFTVELSGGTPNGSVTLDFPSFSTASPATYQFHLKIGDAAEAPLSGAPATFSLDGTGRRTITLRVTN